MNQKYSSYVKVTALALTFGFTSCVEDEGNYTLSPINEISISGIEEEYTRIAYSETLSIQPKLEGTLSGTDESKYAYKWFFSAGITTTEHTEISRERNLEYPVDIAPGGYALYFQVTDTETGMKWETSTNLYVSSPFVRGFYLFGDKEDGTCGMDFVSMIDGRDTTVVKDIFTNSKGIRGAKNLLFTGDTYSNQEEVIDLWMITEEDSYSVEYSSMQESFDIIEGVSAETLIFPTIPVTRPLKMMEIYPHALGADNMNRSNRARFFMTENEFFTVSLTGATEAYGNPRNRYSTSTNELFKPSRYVFYTENNSMLHYSYIMIYDETNHCFVGMNGYLTSASFCKKYTTDGENPFYFDQTKYPSVRSLVYGENGYGNAGRSYALMKDTDGKYYVYGFVVADTPTKYYGNEIDQTVAVNFKDASHYAFFSMQSIILYAVGTELWAYDYNRNEAKLIQDFGAEITYLAMDYHSANDATHFIVATYNSTEKGCVRKFNLADDQNKIEVTPREKEVWKTDLRVVKVEYRNCTF